MKIIRAKDYADMSRKAANIISAQVIMKPNCVLADDVEVGTTSDAVATAYRTGHFNENSLITDNSHAISETDKEALRSAGILLSDAVAY